MAKFDDIDAIYTAKKKGKVEGEKEKQLEIVVKLLLIGTSIEMIAELTGLSIFPKRNMAILWNAYLKSHARRIYGVWVAIL
jgi:hypothetical protein